MKYKFTNTEIKSVFGHYPTKAREQLLYIRDLIFDVAARHKLGAVEESLKWGQPSYVPTSKCGTPVRLGIEKKNPNHLGLYVHCGTKVIEAISHVYGSRLKYDGNRGVLFNYNDELDEEILIHFISLALTYHKE